MHKIGDGKVTKEVVCGLSYKKGIEPINVPIRRTKIALLGIPGSGKTTMAKLLSDELGFTHVHSGDIVSHVFKNDKSTLARLTKCRLAPKEHIIRESIINAMYQCNNDLMVLDGFPRSMAQCQYMRERYRFGDEITFIYLWTKIDTSVQRMAMMGEKYKESKTQRKHRISEYLNFIKQINNAIGIHLIDADNGSARDVFDRIVIFLKEIDASGDNRFEGTPSCLANSK